MKQESRLGLTQMHHVRNSGGRGGRVGLSKIRKTFHIYFLYRHRNYKKFEQKQKGIPLFLVLRRGYVRQGKGRALSRKLAAISILCSVRPPLLLAVQPCPSIFICPCSTVPISSVQWVPAWGPGWAAAWWGVKSGGERPWGASPSRAPAGWAPPARSWTESQFSCSHGCSPHHRGCTCSRLG